MIDEAEERGKELSDHGLWLCKFKARCLAIYQHSMLNELLQ